MRPGVVRARGFSTRFNKLVRRFGCIHARKAFTRPTAAGERQRIGQTAAPRSASRSEIKQCAANERPSAGALDKRAGAVIVRASFIVSSRHNNSVSRASRLIIGGPRDSSASWPHARARVGFESISTVQSFRSDRSGDGYNLARSRAIVHIECRPDQDV